MNIKKSKRLVSLLLAGITGAACAASVSSLQAAKSWTTYLPSARNGVNIINGTHAGGRNGEVKLDSVSDMGDQEIYALFKQGTKQLCSSSVIYKGYGFYNLALDPGTKGSTVTLFGGNNRWVSWDCKAAKGQVKFP